MCYCYKNCFIALAGLSGLVEAGLAHAKSHRRVQRMPPQCSYSDDKTCYFLLYFSGSKFCSSDNVQCLEVEPDGHCRMTGGVYTKMEASGGGYSIVSSTESDCECYNGVAGPTTFPADSDEDVSGFSSSCKDGVKLVTGKWCEKSSLEPSYHCATGGKFTENIKKMCGGSYDFDVLNGDMCNKVGFHLKGRKILKHVAANASSPTTIRSASSPRGAWTLPMLVVMALSCLQA